MQQQDLEDNTTEDVFLSFVTQVPVSVTNISLDNDFLLHAAFTYENSTSGFNITSSDNSSMSDIVINEVNEVSVMCLSARV